MKIHVESCTIFEKSSKVTVVTSGFALWWRLMSQDWGCPPMYFLTKSPIALIFLLICPLFMRGVQKNQFFGLLGNRPASLSTKLDIESKADATFTNLLFSFYNDKHPHSV